MRLDRYTRQIYIRQIVFIRLNAASSLILTVKFQSRKQDNSPQRQLAPRQLVPHSEDNSTHIAEDNSPNVVFMHKKRCLTCMPHSMPRSRIRVSSNQQVAQRAAISQLRDIINVWGPLRCSRAANVTVSGPIWLKFELILFFLSSSHASLKVSDQ